jgi:hypothetical protein
MRHSGIIHPKKLSGSSGSAVAWSFCFLRAEYRPFQRGRRNCRAHQRHSSRRKECHIRKRSKKRSHRALKRGRSEYEGLSAGAPASRPALACRIASYPCPLLGIKASVSRIDVEGLLCSAYGCVSIDLLEARRAQHLCHKSPTCR